MRTLISKVLSLFIVISMVSCTSPGKRTAMGAGIGAGTGAVIGGLIGSQSGNAGKGALIGAALGGAMGTFIGNRLDKQAKELERLAEVRRTEDGLVARLKSDILFDTNSSTLKSATSGNVDQIAQILKKYPENNIAVIGHTDNSGADSYNFSLSQRRAAAVASRLMSSGVPSAYLSQQGAGESQPIADNTSPAGRSRNRRVELVITVDPSRVPKS